VRRYIPTVRSPSRRHRLRASAARRAAWRSRGPAATSAESSACLCSNAVGLTLVLKGEMGETNECDCIFRCRPPCRRHRLRVRASAARRATWRGRRLGSLTTREVGENNECDDIFRLLVGQSAARRDDFVPIYGWQLLRM